MILRTIQRWFHRRYIQVKTYFQPLESIADDAAGLVYSGNFYLADIYDKRIQKLIKNRTFTAREERATRGLLDYFYFHAGNYSLQQKPDDNAHFYFTKAQIILLNFEGHSFPSDAAAIQLYKDVEGKLRQLFDKEIKMFKTFKDAERYLDNLINDKLRNDMFDHKITDEHIQEILKLKETKKQDKKLKVLQIIGAERSDELNTPLKEEGKSQAYRDKVLDVIIEFASVLSPIEPSNFKDRYNFQRRIFGVLIKVFSMGEYTKNNAGLEEWLLWIERIELKVKPFFYSKYNEPMKLISKILDDVMEGTLEPQLDHAKNVWATINQLQVAVANNVKSVGELNKNNEEERKAFDIKLEQKQIEFDQKMEQKEVELNKKIATISALDGEVSQLLEKLKTTESSVQLLQKQMSTLMTKLPGLVSFPPPETDQSQSGLLSMFSSIFPRKSTNPQPQLENIAGAGMENR